MSGAPELCPEWGGLVSLDLRFRYRSRWLVATRALIAELCSDCLESSDLSQQLIMVGQELLENLVKYSAGERSSFSFELLVSEGQPIVRIGTRNLASREQLERAVGILTELEQCRDPQLLFAAMVARSGERAGSGLGLARLRAEVGCELSYAVTGQCLTLLAKRVVEPRLRRVDG